MKQRRSVWIFLALVLIAAAVTGCNDLLGPSTYTFKNESSVTVSVAPNGQTWPPAVIGPGETIQIVPDENYSQMQYFYLPNTVYPVYTDDNTTTFYDKN